MTFGIETRVPFLDFRLVVYLLSLPDEYKYKKGTTKRILRDALNEYLPELVKQRKDKIGFASPDFKLLKELDEKHWS